jgi:hypothetical protein
MLTNLSAERLRVFPGAANARAGERKASPVRKNVRRIGTNLGRGRLGGVTTIVRKSYPGGRCYLLGELIQDTASRYYYRHLGAKLAFVVGKSPSIHIMPCPACPDWLASQRPSSREDRPRGHP